MKRLKKAFLLLLRAFMRSHKWWRLYYWTDLKIFELSGIYIMPRCYYHCLYISCMWLVTFNKFQNLANRIIHTIPYCIRFEEA